MGDNTESLFEKVLPLETRHNEVGVLFAYFDYNHYLWYY